ncbi:SulP family inorganic anion transporter [Segnochrobactrum spirostomi]|uniref:STAS domain-containing protein n=1 Tax=Segnochrobactrum spirostomi TaxID=2608987 RepID=A0A6A7XZC2_9HYPH|nr:SulP family inorganic anion transporter [Segnochrobactrum spirostomi]MQT11261.1 STAS domain-containing protein [Segnochrobactrum spirostomi]
MSVLSSDHRPPQPRASTIALFTPKLVTALQEGYSLATLRADAIAGLTVAIVALPLSMAIAIASGTTPDRGLFTAIVAGFLISALGGSRFQIGGPTAAFIVVVHRIVDVHGFDGLVLATLIAGAVLIAIGALRLGTYVKYIPYPVVIGFTAGIAISIFVSQIKDLLGLTVPLPGDFVPKIAALAAALPQTNPAAVAIALLSIGLIVGLRKVRPKWPGFLIAVVAAALVATGLGLGVATIGSAFGGVPRTLPAPTLPVFSLAKVTAVLPDAMTIALLAAVESLLSAVVADGMTGRRHRSNCELVAQGVANIASALFGGISATGAIARTATNIRAGGRTPVSGILHALFLALFMLVAAPLLSYIPLAALAAILAVVAWNIAEIEHVREILTRSAIGDRIVLALTLGLTVFVDLTVAIEVGVVLAAFLFMHRMAQAVEVSTGAALVREDEADTLTCDLPDQDPGVVLYRIDGPFFFGATQQVVSALDHTGETPRAIILDFSNVPLIDSTAATALRSAVEKARKMGARVVIAGARPNIRHALRDYDVKPPSVTFAANVEAAHAALGEAAPR